MRVIGSETPRVSRPPRILPNDNLPWCRCCSRLRLIQEDEHTNDNDADTNECQHDCTRAQIAHRFILDGDFLDFRMAPKALADNSRHYPVLWEEGNIEVAASELDGLYGLYDLFAQPPAARPDPSID